MGDKDSVSSLKKLAPALKQSAKGIERSDQIKSRSKRFDY